MTKFFPGDLVRVAENHEIVGVVLATRTDGRYLLECPDGNVASVPAIALERLEKKSARVSGEFAWIAIKSLEKPVQEDDTKTLRHVAAFIVAYGPRILNGEIELQAAIAEWSNQHTPTTEETT